MPSALPKDVVERVLSQFVLDREGRHGPKHWDRVRITGLEIAAFRKFDPLVFELFSLFHDSCRVEEGHDPHHGLRGAALAEELCGRMGIISEMSFSRAVEACRLHTSCSRHNDPVIQACFDADRLDLPRVGIEPNPKLISAETWSNNALRLGAVKRARSSGFDRGNDGSPAEGHQVSARPASLVTRKGLDIDRLVLVHVGRGFPKDGWLRPNFEFSNSGHTLLRPPRLVVEFCLNGTIRNDHFFSHLNSVTMIPFRCLDARSVEQCLSLWPTGTAFLGPIQIPPGSLLLYDSAAVATAALDLAPGIETATFPSSTQIEKERYLDHVLASNGYPVMQIHSWNPGFQSTTWTDPYTMQDFFEAHNLSATQELLIDAARQLNVPNATGAYGYPVGKLLSRLEEFFICFCNAGSEIWWTNFAVDRGSVALKRFRDLRRAARDSLPSHLLDTASWKLVELYGTAAEWLMEQHITFFDDGVFDLRYLDFSGFPESKMNDAEAFHEVGDPAGSVGNAELTVRRAWNFRRFRTELSPDTSIVPNHPFVEALQAAVRNGNERGPLHERPKTIDDVLGLWTAYIDHELPFFHSEVMRRAADIEPELRRPPSTRKYGGEGYLYA